MVEQLHATIPAAGLAIIPNAGHVGKMDEPEAFNAHVRRFCLDHDAASHHASTDRGSRCPPRPPSVNVGQTRGEERWRALEFVRFVLGYSPLSVAAKRR
jgi:hypothetical protein